LFDKWSFVGTTNRHPEILTDDDLVGLIGNFVTSRLERNKENPENWISRLKIMR
jgi:hypothetical protein